MSAFASRKFLLTLATMLTALGMVMSGALSPGEGMQAVLTAAGGYLLAEGAGDVAGRLKGEGDAPAINQ
mgnify:CR=1 FL=1